MLTRELLFFRTPRFQDNIDGVMSFDDVKRFLDACKPRDYNRLLKEYSSALFPLFGRPDDDPNEKLLLTEPEKAVDPTTAVDCQNMSTLLRAALLLCHFADDPTCDYEELEGAGLIIHEEKDGADRLSIGIQLEDTPETRRFITDAINQLPPDFEQVLSWISEGALALSIATDPIGLCDNTPQFMCDALLNRLTDLMLHGVTVRIRRRATRATPHSPASSLWLAMLEGSLSGRVGICENCSGPYVAGKERGQRRRTCSDRCRKALSKKSRAH